MYYLKKDSEHVHCIEFDNDVVKLRNSDEAKLTSGVKYALKVFLLSIYHGNDLGSGEELSFDKVIF